MTLSVIIVSWNVKALLERCLDSVFQNTRELETEVLVADNSSQDGSPEYLEELAKSKKNLKVILNKRNLGFAQANNLARQQAKGEFILFLNPDTEIIGDACQKAIQAMKENRDWGIIGSRLVDPDAKVQMSVKSFPSIKNQLMLLLKLHYLFPKSGIVRDYFQKDRDYEKTDEVDQVAGAFMMTGKEIIKKVGSFDERFHLWFEDVDFCRRMKEAGYKVVYYPRAKVLHHGGESFSQLLSLKRQKIYNMSLLAYFKKYYSFFYYWPLVLARPLSLLLARLSEIYSVSRKKQIKKRLKLE